MSTHVLVITEKTSSARKIAQALDDTKKPKIFREKGVPYFISKKGNKTIIIVSALGHIYGIAQKGTGWSYPIYEMNWVPLHLIDKKRKRVHFYIEIIKQLNHGVTEYVSACDNDNEGSLIAFNILLYACGEKSLDKANRMRYSTLTSEDLLTAWKKLEKLDFSNINAGKVRHEIDWLFGINFSRALSIAFTKTAKKRKILSIGRVQGPTLKFIYDKKEQIDRFIPIPYWKIYAETKINGEVFPLEYSINSLKLDGEAQVKELVKKCRRKEGKIVSIKESKQNISPPAPFNLGDLQKEAYRKFKIMPTDTLKITEMLYLSAYISYPRTNSQKLPDSINLYAILSNLKINNNYKDLIEELEHKKNLKASQGKQEDTAHPAIYPTGIIPKNLEKTETKIYDLICRRFLSCLGEPSIHQNIIAYVDVNEYQFLLKEKKIIQLGWMYSYFPYVTLKEQNLPEIYVGMKIPVTKLITRRKYTKKTSRYNQGSLLKLMEDQGIGTKTSRSNIIDTLYKRDYITGNPIRITKLGEAVIQTLQEYSPVILSTQLTKYLENQLEGVQMGKIEYETILEDTLKTIKPLLNQFKEEEIKIGTRLFNYLSDNYPVMNKNGCKICGKQNMKDKTYCNIHMILYYNLKKNYVIWKKALNISWTEYLKKLLTLSGTGRLVKEVCQDILN